MVTCVNLFGAMLEYTQALRYYTTQYTICHFGVQLRRVSQKAHIMRFRNPQSDDVAFVYWKDLMVHQVKEFCLLDICMYIQVGSIAEGNGEVNSSLYAIMTTT